MPETKMSKSAASRIQSSQAKNGRNMSSSGFAARAQSAADRAANQGSYGGGSAVSGNKQVGGGWGCAVM